MPRAGQGIDTGAGHGSRAWGLASPGACSDQIHCSIHSKLIVCSIPMLMSVPACRNSKKLLGMAFTTTPTSCSVYVTQSSWLRQKSVRQQGKQEGRGEGGGGEGETGCEWAANGQEVRVMKRWE